MRTKFIPIVGIVSFLLIGIYSFGQVAPTQTITVDNITGFVPLPNGAASESTLQEINLSLAGGVVGAKMQDGAGNPLTSQLNGSQQALDVGVNVLGVQIDPRDRNWSLSNGTDSVTSFQGTSPWLTKETDGTNQLTTLFDLDASGLTHEWNLGASIRLPASGGSVAGGTSTNPIRIDPTGATTQPVSGTITANQGGSWTVLQGSPPWSVSQSGSWTTGRTWNLSSGSDSVAAAQSGAWNITNISGTISLPTGASTATKQDTGNTTLALIDSDLVSFESTNHSDLATINTTLNKTIGPVSPGTAATNSLLFGGIYNSVLPTLTTGQQASAQLDSTGQLRAISMVTDGGRTAAVVRNSTPATPDGALVVALSPNSFQVPINAVQSGNWSTRNQDGSGNLLTSQANGAQRALDVGIDVAGVQVDPRAIRALTSSDVVSAAQSGTWTVQQGSAPWSQNVTQFGGNNLSTGTGAGGSGVPRVTVSNDSNILSTQSGTWTVQPGNTANTTPWLVTVSTALPSGTNTIGATAPVDGFKATYSAMANGITVPAAATDVFTVGGSGTKTIRVTRIAVSGTTTAGSGSSINVTLLKRSTANTGGTSSSSSKVPHDSTNAAATASVVSYTANPTVGTLVGGIRSDRLEIPTVGAIGEPLMWDFGTRPGQGIVLRGTTEQLSINFNGATITTPVISFDVEWTEE